MGVGVGEAPQNKKCSPLNFLFDNHNPNSKYSLYPHKSWHELAECAEVGV